MIILQHVHVDYPEADQPDVEGGKGGRISMVSGTMTWLTSSRAGFTPLPMNMTYVAALVTRVFLDAFV